MRGPEAIGRDDATAPKPSSKSPLSELPRLNYHSVVSVSIFDISVMEFSQSNLDET